MKIQGLDVLEMLPGGRALLRDEDVTDAIQGLYTAGMMSSFDYDDEELCELIYALENAASSAEMNDSNLSENFLNMEGLTPEKIRHFLNNICSNSQMFGGVKNYFEVGCGTGSTYIASNFGTNLNSSYVCDIFCEGKLGIDGRAKFLENCNRHLRYVPENILEQDCFSIDLSSFKEKINIYLFDGPHEIDDHEKALTYFEEIFDNRIIIMIDDWNDQRVQVGTLLGLSKIDYNIEYWRYGPANFHIAQFTPGCYIPRVEIKINRDSNMLSRPKGYSIPFGDPYRWHNGFMIMVLKKRGIK